MTPVAQFQNGQVVRDAVTGYEGMIVCTCLWLNGCYRYVVQAQKLKEDGKPVEDISVDEKQLVLVEATAHAGQHETGGPRPHVSPPTLRR